MLPKTAKDTKDSQSRLDFFLMRHPHFISIYIPLWSRDDFLEFGEAGDHNTVEH